MPKEIIQPKLAKPDLNDPFTWASLARTHTQWLRVVGPQLELDVPKMILGNILYLIINDDANAFSLYFNPKWEGTHQAILERMNWEIMTPETPKEIKNILTPVKQSIELLDMTTATGYTQAKKEWTAMKNWVKVEIAKRPKWKKAEKYYSETSKVWKPFWNEFLFGKKDLYKKEI